MTVAAVATAAVLAVWAVVVEDEVAAAVRAEGAHQDVQAAVEIEEAFIAPPDNLAV